MQIWNGTRFIWKADLITQGESGGGRGLCLNQVWKDGWNGNVQTIWLERRDYEELGSRLGNGGDYEYIISIKIRDTIINPTPTAIVGICK